MFRRIRHIPSHSFSSTKRGFQDHLPPIYATFHELPASVAIELLLLPCSSLFPSTQLLQPCSVCRKPHNNHQSSGHPSCLMIQEFLRYHISAMQALTYRYGYHGRLRYLSLRLCFRWQPLHWQVRSPASYCGHVPDAAACLYSVMNILSLPAEHLR